MSDEPNPINQLFDVFSSPERREILYHLHEHGSPVPVDELPASETALHHVHLPKMAEAGVVSHEGEMCTPTYSSKIAELIELSRQL